MLPARSRHCQLKGHLRNRVAHSGRLSRKHATAGLACLLRSWPSWILQSFPVCNFSLGFGSGAKPTRGPAIQTQIRFLRVLTFRVSTDP